MVNKKSKGNMMPHKKTTPEKQPAEISGYQKTLNSKKAAKIYALFGVVTLFATTLYWALLGARLQAGNADQVVNAYLFKDLATFHGAVIPGQHSFITKWPLFILVKIFGYSTLAYTSLTVITVLLTVALLALILYRIERRLYIFGTLCLALASILLLVPAMPYAGGILPVNMAMLTTRNIEYLLYVGGLALIIHSSRVKSLHFLLGIALLAVLIAGDKLFLPLSIGGATIALLLYVISKGRHLVRTSAIWLLASIASSLLAFGILRLISTTHLAHITSQAVSGPYGLSNSPRNLVQGLIFLVTGLLTNFGANPAFDITKIRDIPHAFISGLLTLGGISYAINLLLLLVGVFASWRLIRISIRYNKDKNIVFDRPAKLSIMLIFSTIVAGVTFVVTSHYYAVDARYLTISLFTIFICSATYLRSRNWKPEVYVVTGCIITFGILLGIATTATTYNEQNKALATINERNTTIALALTQHPVNTLMGDYWRVLPIKQASKNSLSVTPLSDCTTERDVLSSNSWHANTTKSFAYLISFDTKLTDYPSCSLKTVVAAYGRPNSSFTVSGSLTNPKEILLFYDNGINKNTPQNTNKLPSTVVPATLNDLQGTTCLGSTTMNIVAHQDDDLLFMNPNLQNDIKNGNCIRTLYLTAGDAGSTQLYWLSRQHGSEAAYHNMIGSGEDFWIERIIKLANNQFVTIANPRGNTKISLIFMHLPDGNLDGSGFRDNHNESLQKLYSGKITTLHTVDKQSAYNSQELVQAIASLMQTYRPTKINTQANFTSKQYPDHSDHMAVGRFVKESYTSYQRQFENNTPPPISYIGYPVSSLPVNVFGDELIKKEETFFIYAKHDSGTCDTLQKCSKTAYIRYLQRQYQQP